MHLPALHMSNTIQSLAVMLTVGLAAGWIAAKFIQAHGLGTIRDILAGMLGAYIGDWMLTRLGFHFGAGLARTTANAAIGAFGCLSLVRFIRWI
jgi:uncharacterized membrane protein YeaQ/YmgE (transglycosylase-associated protein family)